MLTPADMVAIKGPDVITNQISLMEARCAQMKPNLGAIAEYKKVQTQLSLGLIKHLDTLFLLLSAISTSLFPSKRR